MRQLAAVLVLVGLVSGAVAGAPALAGGGGTYVTLIDNADNNWNHTPDSGYSNGDMYPLSVDNADLVHPVEFYVSVTGPVGGGTLSIRAYDVESDDLNADGCGYPEVDYVYFNGYLLGTLSGAASAYSKSEFPVLHSQVVPGDNRVQILLDSQHAGSGCITAVIDWGVLTLSPSVGGAARLPGVPTSAAGTTASNGVLAVIAGSALALAAGGYALRHGTGRN